MKFINVASASYWPPWFPKLGWRVTLSGTALDAFGCKGTKNNERIIEIDANSSEYAKKMQKSLAYCKKVCNFAAVFQNYVN